jgi:uncharacterized protein with HEPN domain
MVKDMTLGEFERNRILFYAATRALEIISEAARRLPGKIRDRHPHLPWREIMDAGNFYRHQYDNVVERFVWRTIHHSLGPLLDMIETEISALNEGDDTLT